MRREKGRTKRQYAAMCLNGFEPGMTAMQGVLDTVKDHMALAEQFGGEFDWTFISMVLCTLQRIEDS